MPKQTGLGAGCWVDGYDLSGDVGSLSRMNCSRGTTELTGIDVSAFERAHTHRDGGFEFQSWFNPSVGQSHKVLADATALAPTPSVVRHAAYLHRKTTFGTTALTGVVKQFDYGLSRGQDGSLVGSVTAESSGFGMEWGRTLTAGKRVDTGATNGASLDTLASAAFGAQWYLQVFAFTGTDVTIKIQDSADNSAWLDVTGSAFTAVTAAPTKQRIETGRTATIRRYLRVATTTSGGFTSCTFGVIAVKNEISTIFTVA